MATDNFGTQEQVDAAVEAVEEWEKAYPEAALTLSDLWNQHLMSVGHKRLGRALLHKEVLAAGVK